MAVAWLTSLAARAAVPVFPCIGPGMLARTERALLSSRIDRAQSPRHAAVLLVAGNVPDDSAQALDRVHDQVPRPRGVYRWDGTGDLAARLAELWSDLLSGREGSVDRLPDQPPNPWRGKGDHGQGGEGMMGGVPYGRPMAMTDDDIRDGLALDAYTASVGPFAPFLPPGLELELTLQGDVIVSAAVFSPPFEQPPEANAPELCAARMLRLLGLPHSADRVALGKRPRAALTLRALPPGLGVDERGNDARTRLDGWLKGRSGTASAPEPRAMLAGLEWHEAMLVLNSFGPKVLRRACLAAVA